MKTKFCLSFLTLTSLVISTQTANAQTYQPSNRKPVSDNTLGTQVSGNGNNFNITGGLNKGQTLFHSFTDFSVPTNGQANFNNPVGNRDIITRVTGGVFSDINGLVNTNGANFFLINPNGIVFGTNARLNVGKAFVGSTANGIDLVDAGGRMITFGANPNGDAPLLSIAPNVLFDVSRLNMGGGTGQISNFGTLQTNNPSQYIGLIGGNVNMNGGKIIAPGGRVDLGGLNNVGTITVGNNGLVFGGDGLRSDVSLINGAGVTVRATGTMDTVNTFFNNVTAPGSSINISANNLDILDSGAKLNDQPAAIDAGLEINSGVQTKAAGDINIDAIGKVNLNNSDVKNTLRPGAEGSIGDIKIKAGTLDLNNNSIVSTLTNGKGNAGNVTVTAKDAVSLADNSYIFSEVEVGGVGNGGTIDINSASLSITNGAQLIASTSGKGDAGNVTVKVSGAVDLSGTKNGLDSAMFSFINTGSVGKGGNITIDAGSFSLREGAEIIASSFGTGDAGNVTVTAKDAASLVNSDIFSTVGTGAIGKGGNITIDAGSFSLQDGAALTASTYGQGNAGNVTVTAKNAVSLTDNSYIFSEVIAGGVGNGGTIDINAGFLSLTNGAQLLTSTREASTTQPAGQGDAGNITVKVSGAVDIAGINGTLPSAIFSDVETGTKGNGGNIAITAGSFSLRDGAKLQASTFGQGDAGNVTVTAKDAVSLVNGDIFSTLGTGAIGKGGNITVDAGSFSLRDGAALTTSTFGQGDAGNVTVTAKDAVSLVNGDIFSTVAAGGVGNGGTIDINSASLSLTNGAQLLTSTREASTTQPPGEGDAGNITVKVTGAVDIAGINGTFSSGIRSNVETGTTGNGGNITIDAGSLSLRDGAELTASTFGTGNAGNVTVTTKDAVSLVNGDIFSTVAAGGVGNGGTIDINSASLSLTNGAQLLTITREASATQPAGQGDAGNVTVKVSGAVDIAGINGTFSSGVRSEVGTGTTGNGGNITIDAGSFSLRDGAELTASTFGTGNAGNVIVTTKDAVFLTSDAYILSSVESGGVGKGGNIEINAGSLSLTNGAQLIGITRGKSDTQPAGQGDAGNVNVKVTGAVDITGTNITDKFFSGIASLVDTGTKGNGGNITVDAGSFSLRDGAQLEASTYGQGNAGTIKVNATDLVTISGKSGNLNSGLFVTSVSETGIAGDIIVTSPQITVDGGFIEAKSLSGNGGNISIGGKLKGESGFSPGSKIDLSNLTPTDLLLLRRGGNISTNAEGNAQQGGDGGNININSDLIVAIPKENSDISANAVKGRGGNVKIDSQGLFGIQFRPRQTDNSDITASSDFDRQGNVNIETPGTDPGRDSTELPNTTTDASNQISQVCSTDNRQNKLTVTGRGGLPPNANDPLTSDVVWQDARAASLQPTVSSAPTPAKLAPPAVGWVFDGKGKVTLIAAGTQGQPTGTRVACPQEVK